MDKKNRAVVVTCCFLGGVLSVGVGVGIHLSLSEVAVALGISVVAAKAILVAFMLLGGVLLIEGGKITYTSYKSYKKELEALKALSLEHEKAIEKHNNIVSILNERSAKFFEEESSLRDKVEELKGKMKKSSNQKNRLEQNDGRGSTIVFEKNEEITAAWNRQFDECDKLYGEISKKTLEYEYSIRSENNEFEKDRTIKERENTLKTSIQSIQSNTDRLKVLSETWLEKTETFINLSKSIWSKLSKFEKNNAKNLIINNRVENPKESTDFDNKNVIVHHQPQSDNIRKKGTSNNSEVILGCSF